MLPRSAAILVVPAALAVLVWSVPSLLRRLGITAPHEEPPPPQKEDPPAHQEEVTQANGTGDEPPQQQTKRNPPAAADVDSDDDEEEDKGSELWKRVEKVLLEYSLSRLGMAASRKWIMMMGDPKNEELARLRSWILMRVNGRKRAPPPSPWQSGCPEIFAGLRAKPVWTTADLGENNFLRPFEENFEAIRDELLALRSQRGFQPLKIPTWASKNNSVASPDGSGSVSHDQGDWNVFYLFLHEVKFPDNCTKCPVTTRLLAELGNRSYTHAFFSALTPGTHIIKHHGPTNKKLRVHLPLTGVPGSEMRVADTMTHGEAGKCLLFDDSFEHEAWHRGDCTRVVLVFDVWHPDLTDKEVQFLSFLQRSRMRAEMAAERAARDERDAKKLEAMRSGGVVPTEDAGDNFYQLLQEARDLLPDNSWWVG